MSISVSGAHLERLEATAEVLLAPLSYATLDAWRRDATRRLKTLVGAEVSAFFLPDAGTAPLFSEETPNVTDAEYLDAAMRAFETFDVLGRLTQVRAGSHMDLLGDRLADYKRTPYVQDFLYPMRCYDGLSVCAGRAGRDGIMPHIHLHKSRPHERFGEEEVAALRLLRPSLRAGVETARKVQVRREELLAMIDALSEGVLLLDARGRVLHANRALTALGHADPELPDVEAAMMRLGQGHARNEPGLPLPPPEREVTTTTARYLLRATLLNEELMGRAPGVMISANRLTTILPSKQALRERSGLTDRQADVALLMAEGLTDRAVAARLGISPHTARNHAKCVLATLQVSTRAQVRPALVKQ